jgi:predicted Zn-dependent peptidase
LVSIVRKETSKKITERELTVAKNKICSSLVLSSERPGNRLFTVGNAMTMRGVYETVDQSIANYRRVTLDAVHDAWADYVNQGGARVTIGPELDVLQ